MPSALLRSLICLWLLSAVLPSAAGALSLMDQIGPNGTFQEGLSNNTTQISNFYASAPQSNVAVVDDFTLADPASVSGVEAGLFASNASVGFGQIERLVGH